MNISDIDKHIVASNESQRKYKCGKCESAFMSELRLKKHIQIHQFNKEVKFCHYYNNSKDCPYEILGCKFKHSDSKACRYGEQCNKSLCQFKHASQNTSEFSYKKHTDNFDVENQSETEKEAPHICR